MGTNVAVEAGKESCGWLHAQAHLWVPDQWHAHMATEARFGHVHYSRSWPHVFTATRAKFGGMYLCSYGNWGKEP